MPPNSPVFALEVSSQGASVGLIAQLAEQVFRYAGCRETPTAELTAALTRAASGTSLGGAGRCDVQFRRRQDTLEVLVSANGGRIWQSACSIP